MSDSTDTIINLLKPFGVSAEETEIYCHIAKNSHLSALELHRALAIPRTRVYRLLDKLVAKKLVTLVLDDNGSKYAASPYKDLEKIVIERELEAKALRSSLPNVFTELSKFWEERQYHSRVHYYSGRDSLKQVTWNSLRAKGIQRIFEVEQDMTAFIKPDTAEKIRQEFADKNIFIKQLTNKKHIKPYTDVAKLVTDLWEVRHLDPKKLRLTFEILTYNDVVAMYNFTRDDEFCVEIYNQSLASMISGFFDLIWIEAKKMKVINVRGEANI